MIVTLSGLPGSGKSTVARLLADKLRLKHYSTGDYMRKMASDRHLTLAQLGQQAEKDKKIDEELDTWQIKLGLTEDNFIIDGRLSFHFIPRSIKIFLSAEIEERAKRIMKDVKFKLRKEEQFKDLDTAVKGIEERGSCESKRFLQYYQTDPYDQKNYDFVIDTTLISAEQAAEMIKEFVESQ
ncbi:MAG TPA: nucleoside monophosphate kinase [Candidatus Nanoarchaeia archaeon]|nr:nucleoside monophosphate kinase [Candidatus Nanoarchaeia archaeon]